MLCTSKWHKLTLGWVIQGEGCEETLVYAKFSNVLSYTIRVASIAERAADAAPCLQYDDNFSTTLARFCFIFRYIPWRWCDVEETFALSNLAYLSIFQMTSQPSPTRSSYWNNHRVQNILIVRTPTHIAQRRYSFRTSNEIASTLLSKKKKRKKNTDDIFKKG